MILSRNWSYPLAMVSMVITGRKREARKSKGSIDRREDDKMIAKLTECRLAECLITTSFLRRQGSAAALAY